MTPEANFLLTCARNSITRAQSPTGDLDPALNKGTLLALAVKHGVLPLLAGLPDFTEHIQEHIRFSLTLTGELLTLLTLFESHRIPVLPLKGPMLAANIYSGVASRAYSDLDLLIHLADKRRAYDLVCSAGYQLHSTLPWKDDLRNKEDELAFVRLDGAVSIDIHWRMIPSYLPQPVDPEALWLDLQLVTLGGRTVRALRDEDLLLLLCTHGAKHLWERLGWICDVAKLLAVRPNLNWDRVLKQANQQYCGRLLLLGLAMARQVAYARLPDEIAAMIEASPAVQTLAAGAEKRLFEDHPSPPPGPEQIRFTLPLIETASGKLRYLNGMALAPTEAEYRALRLPSAFYVLYYPFRALRLIWKNRLIAALVLAAALLPIVPSRLSAMGDFFVVADELKPAVVIVVVAGDPDSRAVEAARIYSQAFRPFKRQGTACRHPLVAQ